MFKMGPASTPKVRIVHPSNATVCISPISTPYLLNTAKTSKRAVGVGLYFIVIYRVSFGSGALFVNFCVELV